jgi:hypothetical protein
MAGDLEVLYRQRGLLGRLAVSLEVADGDGGVTEIHGAERALLH